MEEPVFEIRHGTIEWKIWADGHISGFPGNCSVINRIKPVLAAREAISSAASEANRKHAEWQDRVNRLR